MGQSIDYCYTSPYAGSWPSRWVDQGIFDSSGEKLVRERDLKKRIAEGNAPRLLAMWNFVVDRAAFISRCRESGIETVAVEDGFFPHYGAAHADPMGFSWESSLPRISFRSNGSESKFEKEGAETRERWLKDFSLQELPSEIKPPFVVWPLQLTGDKVNQWDQAFKNWDQLIRHFRRCLPDEVQLVLKPHPIGEPAITGPLPDNTVMVPKHTDLKSLLQRAAGAAGVNSTALLEARLMFRLPVWTYGRGWHTGHDEMFLPVHFRHQPREIARVEWLESPGHRRCPRLEAYTNWFLGQLMARHLCLKNRDRKDTAEIRTRLDRLSLSNYLRYGEEIFQQGPPKS